MLSCNHCCNSVYCAASTGGVLDESAGATGDTSVGADGSAGVIASVVGDVSVEVVAGELVSGGAVGTTESGVDDDDEILSA